MPIQQIIPVLPSTDFARTQQYYALLGFTRVSTYPDYLILIRDGQELHFFLEEGDPTYGHGHSHFGVYIRVHGLNDLHSALGAAGLAAEPPSPRPWGMNEMELIDPDGSLLRLGERLPPEQPAESNG